MLTASQMSGVFRFRQAYGNFEPETEVTRYFRSKPALVYDKASNRYRDTKTGRYEGVILTNIKTRDRDSARILSRKKDLENKAAA